MLSAAKGLRPLAELVLKEIADTVSNVSLHSHSQLIMLNGPQPFLALLPGAKALRLYGDFGALNDPRIARAEAVMKIGAKASPTFSSVLVINDARLVDAAFRALVLAAHARAHS